jgi:hypothetical protein
MLDVLAEVTDERVKTGPGRRGRLFGFTGLIRIIGWSPWVARLFGLWLAAGIRFSGRLSNPGR